ncbi:hypothetical protein BESB_011990 [Besnoitia besnoiti]|uniref:Transmembrane protein n=1 Tax=Besnoitia besnoiti TaxID=94643 RepID=A0A2A9MAF0_BESBE|nr:hypothetical protein BESB_011990 [Besnoitia besnoiti]PFH32587.1 hypothetical protein BESB_011990 [Besnoitia besnoiti]
MERQRLRGSPEGWRALDQLCEPVALLRAAEAQADPATPSIFVQGLLTAEGHFRKSLTAMKDSLGIWTLPVLFLSSGVFGGVVGTATFRTRMTALKKKTDASAGVSAVPCSRAEPHIRPWSRLHPGIQGKGAEQSSCVPRNGFSTSYQQQAPASPSPVSSSARFTLLKLGVTGDERRRGHQETLDPSPESAGAAGSPKALEASSVQRPEAARPGSGTFLAGSLHASAAAVAWVSEEAQSGGEHRLPAGRVSADPYTVLSKEIRMNKKGWSDAFDDEDEDHRGNEGTGPNPYTRSTELFTVAELFQLFLLPAAALTVALGCTWTWVKKSCSLADANDFIQATLWIKGIGGPPPSLSKVDADERS